MPRGPAPAGVEVDLGLRADHGDPLPLGGPGSQVSGDLDRLGERAETEELACDPFGRRLPQDHALGEEEGHEWDDGERRREAPAERPTRDAPGQRVHAEAGEERDGWEEEHKVLVAEVEAGRRPDEREEC